MDWQPIETAPKDAKMLLLLQGGHQEDYHSRVFTGFWGDKFAGWEPDDPANYAWCNWHEGLNEEDIWKTEDGVTHWMPLPNPPSD